MTPSSSLNSAPPAWAVELAAGLRHAVGVESMRIAPEARRIEIATLGPVDEAALRAELVEALRRIAESGEFHRAPEGMLAGVNFIKASGRLTLEKPACDTAPKLWRWREIPWPG